MAHLSSFLAAGLAGVLAWDFLIAPPTSDRGLVASASVVAGGEAAVTTSVSPTVNRSRKSDRLSGAEPSSGAHPTIAKVEFGPGDTILLRDRAGGTLFAVDPSAQRTVIAKNVSLPQLTVQTSARKMPEMPAPTLEPAVTQEPPRNTTISIGRKPEPKRPAGCDPAFSPIAAPQLGHIFGRCVTSIEAPTRLALAQ